MNQWFYYWFLVPILAMLIVVVLCALRYSKRLTITLGVVALCFAASIWAYGASQTGWAYAAMGAMAFPVVYIFGMGFADSRRCKQERAQLRCARLEDRPSLTLDELHAAYYKDTEVSQPLMEEAWTEMTKTLRIPPGQLRPSDRFDVELAVSLPRYEREWWYSDEMTELGTTIDFLVEDLLEDLPLDGTEYEAIPLDTVDDFVRLYAQVTLKTHADARIRGGFPE